MAMFSVPTSFPSTRRQSPRLQSCGSYFGFVLRTASFFGSADRLDDHTIGLQQILTLYECEIVGRGVVRIALHLLPETVRPID